MRRKVEDDGFGKHARCALARSLTPVTRGTVTLESVGPLHDLTLMN